MNLKEFAECILNNPTLWDYNMHQGIINLDNDNQDECYLHVYDGTVDILNCWVQENIKIS